MFGGLPLSGLRVLLAWGERNGSLGQSEISRFLVLRKSKVTEACQGLQASGLIDRKPMPLDRRNSIAVATQAGEKLTSAIIASIASESENYIRPVAQGEIGFYVEVARITMGSLRMNRKRMQL